MKIKDLADLELIKDVFAETDLGPELGEDKETDLVLPEDIEIRCKSCGKVFTFSIGEQEFYKSKSFPFPKRCKKCSKERRRKFLNYK